MRPPNLKALRMFDAAARHLNFGRAAEELKLTQGAVAQQVRQLEADLGVLLFKRVARGLVLTDTGRVYHVSIRRALEIIDDATRKLYPESEDILLSVTPSFASRWLVPRLVSFSKTHPEIDIQTIASERLADFRADRVDIAIRQGFPPFGADLQLELLAPLDLCAVCSPGYAKQAGDIRRLEDFTPCRLIQDSHRHWQRLFDESTLPLRRKTMEFNQTTLAIDAAINGQGIALAPRLLVADDLARDKLVRLWRDRSPQQGGFYVVYPRTAKSKVSARSKVIKWLHAEAGNAEHG